MMRVLTSGKGVVCLLAGALLLAIWKPELGANGSLLHPEYSTEFLVILIFLIQGMRMKISSLSIICRKPIGSIALQVGIIFLPIIGVSLARFSGLLTEDLYQSFFFVAILPTTISSCVVYTSNVNGNAEYALGHSTLSNLIAPFIVPLLWFSSDMFILSSHIFILKIIGLVIVPCLVGWFSVRVFPKARPFLLADWVAGVPMLTIVLLVYLTFCEGVSELGAPFFLEKVWVILPACIIFVLLIHLLGWFGAGRWSKSRDIHVAQFFCLSQKSLATGIPFASILFADSGENLIQMTIPLFCIHFLQLVLGAGLFQVVSKWVAIEEITK